MEDVAESNGAGVSQIAVAPGTAAHRTAELRKDSTIDGANDRPSDKITSSRESVTQLPSPTLTPADPTHQPPPTESATHTIRHGVSATDGKMEGIPTPDHSGDSQSSPEELSAAEDLANERQEPEVKQEEVDVPVKNRSRSGTKTSNPDGVRRLSASKIQELTQAPGSLPVATIPDRQPAQQPLTAGFAEMGNRAPIAEQIRRVPSQVMNSDQLQSDGTNPRVLHHARPNTASRNLSTPPTTRRKSNSQSSKKPEPSRRNSFHPAPRPPPLDLDGQSNFPPATKNNGAPVHTEPLEVNGHTSLPPSVPLPPMSIPTLLQLELAAQRPSPLYIYQSYAGEQPYESSAIKFERLKNFLVLPVYLERTMNFGALACLDAWLWTFTILPIRFCIAVGVLVRWWGSVLLKEAKWLVGFVWYGLGRLWERGRRGRPVSRASSRASTRTDVSESRSRSRAREPATTGVTNGHANHGTAPNGNGLATGTDWQTRRADMHRTSHGGHGLGHAPKRSQNRLNSGGPFRHRRTQSMPSNLTSFHKADLLQMAVIICCSLALLKLDASRMYHFIRAQSQIKLYVIFNLLEVGDRLLSAVGQDIMECLFSSETLSRNSSGRSKVMLPFGMFLLALVYNMFHAAVLFYQVITLNVAVNSYSHALLSLLMSNQFVEVKSAVFKRFEKENNFQLTCADIVERFQLWIMLLIIGLRNVVEVGGLSVPGAGSEMDGEGGMSTMPIHTASILPASFTILPSWMWSGEVLSPFLIVIGSEMIVDWIKHAFINKFNNIKPNFYSRILDILCKDYYTNAFVTPSLTRRLGLPLIPLSCLFIRASVQTYHMFVATHVPGPLPPSTQTSLSVDSATPSPAIRAALDRLDTVIRNALGRAVYGYPYSADGTIENLTDAAGTPLPPPSHPPTFLGWTSDDAIAAVMMVVVFLLIFLVLLVVKLLLGMVLLRYARDRYARMKTKEAAVAAGKAERDVFDAKGKRVGGYGQVEIGEERRRWIYADDPEGLRKQQEKEKRNERKEAEGSGRDLETVMRYEMIARKIW